MLADALAGHMDTDEELLATALEVFVPDPATEELVADLSGEEYEPPDVSEELSEQLDADEDLVAEAVQELKTHELIAEAADRSLYVAQRAVDVGPYVIEDDHIIN